jgi:hypothetical protein
LLKQDEIFKEDLAVVTYIEKFQYLKFNLLMKLGNQFWVQLAFPNFPIKNISYVFSSYVYTPSLLTVPSNT